MVVVSSQEPEDGQGFVTSRGFKVEFLPVTTLLEKAYAAHSEPKPPTYEVKTVTGGVEIHTHTPETLETDEEKRAWAEYQLACQKQQQELRRAILRLILLRGLKVEGASENDADWQSEQKFIGLEIPADPLELRLHWLQTEVLDDGDAERVVFGVLARSGVPEEDLLKMRSSFRRALGRTGGNPVGGTAAPGGQVVGAGKVRTGRGRAAVGANSQPVRRAKHK